VAPPKSDHDRLNDLEKAVAELAGAVTSLYSATSRFALFLAKESTLHSGAYRVLIKDFEGVQASLRATLEHLSEAKKDGE
jgi:hypothetical protein